MKRQKRSRYIEDMIADLLFISGYTFGAKDIVPFLEDCTKKEYEQVGKLLNEAAETGEKIINILNNAAIREGG